MDAIFDDALFGAPASEVSASGTAAPGQAPAPVPVGSVEWYMERDAQPAGPFRLERLRELWHHGELGPDTLFWCEAWPGWRPMSRVPELVAALTDAGLPTVAADSVPAASARAKEKEAEVKVVSALPSLVAQEEAWMRKMREEQEQAKEEERAALLNAPSAPVPTPIPVPVPVQFVPVPVPVAPPVVAPPVIPSLADTEAPAPARRGKGLLVGAVMGGAAVALVTGALLLLPRIQLAPVAEAPRQEASTTASVTPPQPPVQAPVPEAPKPAPPVVAAAPAVQPVAPAPAPAPVVTPPAEKKQEPQVVTAVARAEPPRAAAVAAVAPVEKKEAETSGRRLVASRPEQSGAVEEERLARAAESAMQRRSPPPVATPAPAAPAKVTGRRALADDASAVDPSNLDDSIDREFEKELGFAKDSPKHKPEDPRSKRTVYLPPEPGADLPESLSTSDVMQVVSSHKDGIVSCIQEHAPPAPESGRGRFVVRWRVQTSGTASDVLMETDELKGTPFARCIMDQVRSWKFPKHRVQSREPVRFPFTY
jgi:hypothetical protein